MHRKGLAAAKETRYCQKFYENLRGKYETAELKPWNTLKTRNESIAAKRRRRRKNSKFLCVHLVPLCGKKEKP
jgi:hypothetical protein